MTTLEAFEALEILVKDHHFPQGRSYRIERMEDAASCVQYKVSIFGLDTASGWEAFGRGRTLVEAVANAVEKVPKT